MKIYFLDMDLTLVAFPCKHGEQGTKRHRTEEGFFKKLKPYAQISSVNAVIEGKDNIYILSNSPTEIADSDKCEWLNEHLPAIPQKNRFFNRGGLSAEKTKAEIAIEILGRPLTLDDILIDDSVENLKTWESAGGYAIQKQPNIPNYPVWHGKKITRMTQLAEILKIA